MELTRPMTKTELIIQLAKLALGVAFGGYFLWVDLPRGTDVGALFEAASQRGVQFVKGSDFVLEGGDSSLRLAYSGVTPKEIEEGVKRLAEAYHELTGVADEHAA